MANSFAAAALELQQIASAPPKIAASAASAFKGLIDAEFPAGSDPYAAAWAALAPSTLARGRTPPPLTDTGATKGTVTVAASGLTIRAAVDGQAHWHQTGTGIMPARPILPEAGSLPASWEQAMNAAARTHLPKGAL